MLFSIMSSSHIDAILFFFLQTNLNVKSSGDLSRLQLKKVHEDHPWPSST